MAEMSDERIQRVATFHEVTDHAQADPGVAVGISISSSGGSNRLQHGQQTSIRKAAQTTAECR